MRKQGVKIEKISETPFQSLLLSFFVVNSQSNKFVMNFKIRYIFIVLSLLLCSEINSMADDFNPKREFRGAWLHVIGQSQYQKKSTKECKKYISSQLDKLSEAGCNVVIFQVRPCADAVYKSDLEPWSEWLTGKRGRQPNPIWDPMQYTIDEAHRRGMEFHAWLNPYRVTSSSKEVLPENHLSNKQPHRFFKYNGQVFFDPAYQENREYICNVVEDILKRYDVDGLHIDDYFYPYPNGKVKFCSDSESYAKFGEGMNIGDWRRKNVDLLIEMLHNRIKEVKPWVRFGVSPFGIWRNKKSDPRGSDSNGLQNYDDLYADVLLWDQKGWVDYFAPQLYWQLDLAAAPSRKLVKWWNDNIKNADLYIGQEVKRTMDNADPSNNDDDELDTKMKLSRMYKNIKGNIWWHGYWVTENYKGVADSLSLKYQSTLALPPVYGQTEKRPQKIDNIRIEREGEDIFLTWDNPENFAGYGEDADYHDMAETDVIRYAVYQFYEGETIDIEDSQTIIAITPFNRLRIYEDTGVTYVVTALDRMNRESRQSALKR